MNKFGRSNNDSTEYDSDASGSESDGAVPTSGDIHNDAPDEQQPDEAHPQDQHHTEQKIYITANGKLVVGLKTNFNKSNTPFTL